MQGVDSRGDVVLNTGMTNTTTAPKFNTTNWRFAEKFILEQGIWDPQDVGCWSIDLLVRRANEVHRTLSL